VLVEVTARCNLSCTYCFARSGEESLEPTLEQLSACFRQLVSNGNTFVQLSGGEPTVRDDLPDIVAAAKSAGCENIQLNSNGIRLDEDRAYTRALAHAGLSFVFMQFDGTEDAIYKQLRGRPLLAEKLGAIEACSAERLGVTLVPTLVPGVNDHNLGDILEFALSHSPAVRGVHFQPVSYFGRYPQPPKNEDRITLPEVLSAIERQTAGKVTAGDLAPSACDHPRCGFHGDFVVMPNTLLQLTPKAATSCCIGAPGAPASGALGPSQDDSRAHLRNRNFVARRWKRSPETGPGERQSCCEGSPARASLRVLGSDNGLVTLDSFLGRVKSHGFTITAMAFQDAYTLDLERLRRCSLHVYQDGRTVPFCARYLTPGSGVRTR
jgi:hypothetical protein